MCGEDQEFFLVLLYIQLPFALEFHDHRDGLPYTSLASRLGCDKVRYRKDLVGCITWACAASARNHYRNIRQVIADVHYFVSCERMLCAELFEVLYLGSRSEIDIVEADSACGESLGYTFGSSSCDDCERVVLHACHAHSHRVFCIEGTIQLATAVSKYTAVGVYAVHIKSECLDLPKLVFHTDL